MNSQYQLIAVLWCLDISTKSTMEKPKIFRFICSLNTIGDWSVTQHPLPKLCSTDSPWAHQPGNIPFLFATQFAQPIVQNKCWKVLTSSQKCWGNKNRGQGRDGRRGPTRSPSGPRHRQTPGSAPSGYCPGLTSEEHQENKQKLGARGLYRAAATEQP